MISMRRRAGLAGRTRARRPSTRSTRPACANSRAERLTLTERPGPFGVASCQLPRGPAGLPQHEVAQGEDEAGLLGQGDELVRREQAALGMLPAHERLEADRALGRERDDRLVDEPQLVALEGPPQVGLELEHGHRPRVHGVVEDLVAVAPLRLGPVHRGVGVAQQVLRTPVARRRRGRCRCSRWRRPRGRPSENGCRSSSWIRSATRVASRASAISSRRIANSSPPRRATVSSERRQPESRSREADEELVAREVAEAVVDELEAVEVEEEDGEVVVVVAATPGHGLPQPVEEEGAVGQPGEGIVERVVEDLLLGALALGDVGLGAGEAHRPARAASRTARPRLSTKRYSPSLWRMRCSLSKWEEAPRRWASRSSRTCA